MDSKQLIYPKQLITSLIEQTDVRLSDFFWVENKKYFPPGCTMSDMVNSTLKEFLKDETSKSELKTIQSLQTRMRRQKKKRWAENTETNTQKYDITSKKNPFFNMYMQYSALSTAQFKQLYGLDDIEEVKTIYLEKVSTWQRNSKVLLIEYPLITSLTPKQVLAAYKIDLIIDLIEIIINSLGGNIDSFLQRKPEVLIDAPFFAPVTHTVPFQNYLDEIAATLFQSDDLEFEILRSRSEKDDEESSLPVLDYIDNQILMALFAYIRPDFYESKQVLAYIGDIAGYLNERPNARHYELVKKRLDMMSTVYFRYKNTKRPLDDQKLTISFFDQVLINSDEEGRLYCNVVFSTALFNAIIQKKMVSVTSSNYNTLDKRLSKLLYHSLQRERILLFLSPGPNKDNLLYKSYDISFFLRAVIFKKQKKSKTINIIKDTLDEFQSKGIAIHHYIIEDGRFNIFFYSLTADEKVDLLQDYTSVLSPSTSNFALTDTETS